MAGLYKQAQYHNYLDQLMDVFDSQTKQAEEVYQSHESAGHVNKLMPEGRDVKEGESTKETDIELQEHKIDAAGKDKSVKYNDSGDGEKVHQNNEEYYASQPPAMDPSDHKVKSSSAHELLMKINNMIKKEAMDDECKKEKMDEVAEEIAKDSDYEDEVSMTEEEEEMAKAAGINPKDYLREKKAGYKAAQSLTEPQRKAVRGWVSLETGKAVANLERQGHIFTKQAALQMVSNVITHLEKQGSIRRTDQPNPAEHYMIIKEAAKKTALSVLDDLNTYTNADTLRQKLLNRGN